MQGKASIILSGTVASGTGSGRRYMRQRRYRIQFIDKLGIAPYSGTLNIRLSGADLKKFALLKKRRGILVKGFRKQGRSFGNVMCYRAELSGIRCAVIVPELSRRVDVAEIISKERLRTNLSLHDGSNVRVRVPAQMPVRRRFVEKA